MISVTDPIQRAYDRTHRMLFEPFQAKKWFVLGFCAFLAELGSGLGQLNYRTNPFGDSVTGGSGRLDALGTWVSNHLALVVSLGLILLVGGLALGALLLWLSSRGQFMFLDGVVKDRLAIVEPWDRFRELGNRLFTFRFVLSLSFLGLLFVVALVGWLIAKPDLEARQFGASAIITLVLCGGILILGVLLLMILETLLHDFVVPIMYLRGVGPEDGFRVLGRELLPGHVGTVILFYLMKLVLGVAAAVLILIGACLTCCVGLLPYLSSVIFLPIHVFFRTYSLRFLEQFGDEWRLIPGPAEVEGPTQGGASDPDK